MRSKASKSESVRPRRRSSTNSQSGAVAVEFALVLPIFLVLVLGIFEFGRAFNIQISLSEAAREAARYAAIHQSDSTYTLGDAQAAGVAAAPSVDLDPGDIAITSSGTSPCNVEVNISHSTPWMTGFPSLVPGMPAELNISGTGVMRCGG